jgi:HD-GYP domain-containing protein (c-di-GMP phosphodiesterase class II)
MKKTNSFFKKIISRRNTAKILSDMAARLNIRILVTDAGDNIIADIGQDGEFEKSGNSGNSMVSYPINAGGDDQIGFIKGSEGCALVASVIDCIAEIESDKRDLTSELLSKYREINLFYDFAENINIRTDFNEMAKLTSMQISELLNADSILIILKNENTGLLEVVFAFGEGAEKYTPLKPEDAVIPERVILSGRAEIVNDLSADVELAGILPKKTGSVLCTPLRIQNRVTGAIYLINENPIAYTSENLKLLMVFSSQIAAFIENGRLLQNLQETFISTVYTLAETIEMRDSYTGDHTRRVMNYSLAIGRNLGISGDELETLKLSSILHDIGKIGISDSVLLKPGKLKDDEFEIIKSHTILGEKILKNIKQLNHIIPGVKYHHERYDGKGYPEGLGGEDINLMARIIAVADSFDAMTTDRPYRKGLSCDAAFSELKKCSSTQFDPAIVDAFIEAFPDIKEK